MGDERVPTDHEHRNKDRTVQNPRFQIQRTPRVLELQDRPAAHGTGLSDKANGQRGPG